MKLIILGSGTCVPSLERNAPGYYLEEKNYRVLVDCGSGTLLQLIRAGRSCNDIDSVFITHGHPDHFADLMPLVHAIRYTPGFTRKKDLHIVAPAKFLQYYNKTVGSLLGEPEDFSIHLIKAEDKQEIGPFHILSAKTMHSDDSIAYRFEAEGRAVVLTGDTDYSDEIIGLSENADLLVTDCSFPDALKGKGHLSAGECGLIAEKAGVKKLLLSHIYPTDIPDSRRVEESRRNFKGDVLLAEDLMEIEV